MDDNKMPLQNTGENNSNEAKPIRMHVMPADIFEEDELYKKVNQGKKLNAENRNSLNIEEKKVENKKEEVKKIPEINKQNLKRPTAPKKKNNIIWISLVVVLLLLASGAGAYYWWMNKQDQENQAKLEEVKKQAELKEKLAQEEEEAKKQVEEEQAKLLAERKARDQQRIKDIIAIQDALNKYKKEKNQYPKILNFGDKLAISDSIEVNISEDPLNKDEYKYTYESDGKTYKLTFVLEENYNELSAGKHELDQWKLLNTDGSISTIIPEPRTKYVILTSSTDTDLDGLTDVEEKLYQTNEKKFDTDQDGYTDHQELLNLYSPINYAPTQLMDSGLVKDFVSEKANYAIYYPSAWELQVLDPDELDVTFVPDNSGEYIELKVYPNEVLINLSQWVEDHLKKELVDEETLNYHTEKFLAKRGKLVGIWIPELFKIYFVNAKNEVIELSYNFANKERVSYKTTFEMMARSLKYLDYGSEERDYSDYEHELFKQNEENLKYDLEHNTVEKIEGVESEESTENNINNTDTTDEGIDTNANEEITSSAENTEQNTDNTVNEAEVNSDTNNTESENNNEEDNVNTEEVENAVEEYNNNLDEYYNSESDNTDNNTNTDLTNPDNTENNTEGSVSE